MPRKNRNKSKNKFLNKTESADSIKPTEVEPVIENKSVNDVNIEHNEEQENEEVLNYLLPRQNPILQIFTKDNEITMYFKHSPESNELIDSIMEIYKYTPYHNTKTKDTLYLLNIKALISLYFSYKFDNIPCYNPCTEDEKVKYLNELNNLKDLRPVSEKKKRINDIIHLFVQNCLNSCKHNFEISNIPVGIINDDGSITPSTPMFIKNYFEGAGTISHVLQASLDTFFIWYLDDKVAKNVYNHLTVTKGYINGQEVKVKYIEKNLEKKSWSKIVSSN